MDWLTDFLRYPLEELPFVFLALMIAFTLHEFAHAYVAYKFGDSTAKNEGRVTLNPREHIDVIGMIFIFIAGFGWAKPVPVNRNNFKSPRLMGIVVSAAGPLSNLLIAFIAILIYHIMMKSGFQPHSTRINEAVFLFLYYSINLNIILFIFNLIPLPPLDGYRIIEDLAPQQVRAKMSQYEHWGVVIFLLMVFITPIGRVTLAPLFSLSTSIFDGLSQMVRFIIGG